MSHIRPLCLGATLLAAALIHAAETPPSSKVAFTRIQVTTNFWCEGAHFADFDKDGKTDIVAGPFIWRGPDFKTPVEYAPPPAQPYNGAKGYSDYFLTYTHDFNGDGWQDILVYSWPGKETAWYQNPKNVAGHWPRHVIFAETDNESPQLGDMNGDGKPELICHTGGRLGFAELDWSDPTKPAKYWPISPEDKKKYFRYTHGYGYGDINGDRKADILDRDGWWEQPKDYRAGGEWKQHKVPFAPEGLRGGGQMLVYDVNGDKLPDVITSWDAHGYGLAWYEQQREGGEIKFTPHIIINTKPEDNRYGVKFSQLHSQALADMDGDGLLDLITGKRFWAHGPAGDAEPNAPAVLYWFQLKRGKDKSVEWIPRLVDDDSGVGTQITVGDLNGDKKPDILSGNKKGIHVFLQK
jgi:hypothetical protein